MSGRDGRAGGVVESVLYFCDGAVHRDDITLIGVKAL